MDIYVLNKERWELIAYLFDRNNFESALDVPENNEKLRRLIMLSDRIEFLKDGFIDWGENDNEL